MARLVPPWVACTLVMVPLAANAAAGPVLLYASAKAGPSHGWEGSTEKGVAISLWGHDLGARVLGSKVTVAGKEIAATDPGFVAEWGATTQPRTAKKLERITFWLRGDMPDGNADGVFVTVGGRSSNTLPFKIDNRGTIWFASPDGSDANDGLYAAHQAGTTHGPWRNFGRSVLRMRPGAFLYLRSGDWTDIHSSGSGPYAYIGYYTPSSTTGRCTYDGGSPQTNGTDDLRITLASFPGDLAVFKNSSVINMSKYWTFANMKWDGDGGQCTLGSVLTFCKTCSDHAVGLDVIGCEFVGSSCSSVEAFGDNFKIVANLFDTAPAGNACHALELGAGNLRLVKDNEISGASAYGIHAYDAGGNCDDLDRVLQGWTIDANRVRASDAGQGYLAALFLGAGERVSIRDVVIRNNVLTASGPGAAMGVEIAAAGDKQEISLYNNTFVRFAVGVGIDYSTSRSVDNVYVKNNIFHDIATYDVENDVTVPISLKLSNNLYAAAPRLFPRELADESPFMGDPLFVDEASMDFHLKPGSAAIAHGVALTEVPDDFDGAQRPSQSCDIGAFEHEAKAQGPQTHELSINCACGAGTGTGMEAGLVVLAVAWRLRRRMR